MRVEIEVDDGDAAGTWRVVIDAVGVAEGDRAVVLTFPDADTAIHTLQQAIAALEDIDPDD